MKLKDESAMVTVRPASVDWMAYLPDNLPLNEIRAIPGTHNSGAIEGECYLWGWAKCQSATIKEQLGMGIRRLDFRLCDNGRPVHIAHRWSSKLLFEDALQEVHHFLDSNPTEAIFMCIKRDWDNRNTWCSGQTVLCMIKSKGFKFCHLPPYSDCIFDGNTTVGMARGCLFISSQDECMWMTPDFSRNLAKDIPGKIDLDRSFLDTWDAGSFASAKLAITDYLDSHQFDCLKQPTSYPTDRHMRGFSANIVCCFGAALPRYTAWFMNSWIQQRCQSNWKGKHLGFVSVDFAHHTVIRYILSLNF
jgi:hypothetical protein